MVQTFYNYEIVKAFSNFSNCKRQVFGACLTHVVKLVYKLFKPYQWHSL